MMVSPFPGMNPYLESPAFWPEVHSRLIVAIADALNPQILPRYRAAIERRIYDISGDEAILIGLPDVTVEQRTPRPESANVAVITPTNPRKVRVPMPIEVRESYLQVKEVASGEVVTALELLSPANKRPGKGRIQYEEKREAVLSSLTHLVEIDLLRSGEPMALTTGNIESDYRVLVSRGYQRPQADLYAFNLTDAIPLFPLPLKEEDMEPIVDLHALLEQIYHRAGYAVAIDYTQAPVPSIVESSLKWMDDLLKERGLR